MHTLTFSTGTGTGSVVHIKQMSGDELEIETHNSTLISEVKRLVRAQIPEMPIFRMRLTTIDDETGEFKLLENKKSLAALGVTSETVVNLIVVDSGCEGKFIREFQTVRCALASCLILAPC